MLHLESPHQGIYAPLSQLMTDSEESEEEIHNSTKHRQQQLQQLQQQPNQRVRNPPNSLAINQRSQQQQQFERQQQQQQRQRQLLQQQHEQLQRQQQFQLNTEAAKINGFQSSSYTTNMLRSVMMSDMVPNGDGAHYDHGSNFSSFNSDYDERNADNVAILGGSSDSKDLANEPMSAMRRFCFIASLLLCVFAVVGFVWLVPCREESTCPALVDRVKTHNWMNNYTKIELKGGVNVVSGLRSWENNLVFLCRGDAFFPEFRADKNKRNGIISLIGSSGAVAWYDEMTDEPVAIDCTLLDVDRNGRPDCLVIDEYGELGAINPISGLWHWRFKERSAHKVDALDFPVILPDLDGDGVLEILVVTSAPLELRTKNHMRKGEIKSGAHALEERNFLRILSGRNGWPIGEGFKIHDCDVLHKLQLENAQTVTFNCLRNNTEAQRSKTLAELYALITNKSIGGQKLLPVGKITQHRHYGQRKDIDAQRNIYSLSGRELVVENRGKCPEDCNVTLILSENRDGKTNVLRNFTNSGMYGMVPAQWHFKNTKTKMSGFVMKFWKWNQLKSDMQNETIKLHDDAGNVHKSYAVKKTKTANALKDNATKPNKQNQTKKHAQHKRALAHEFPNNDFSTFEHLIQKRHTYTVPTQDVVRVQRSIAANATKQKPNNSNLMLDNYKMQMITETVILVLFIGADTRIENTSQSNIVQFCRNDRTEVVCQPDLNNQENSMLIADLDQDGSQELVSYTSTFVQANDDVQNWKLVTYVQLLRLQSELPAFYGEEKRN